ncbi:suppressor of fused domain protein [Stigmatella sp. ncwal1]|uniref:Suppressor of fused domain protein n=1 Tax=Stigmatella ashevillensis TaxID=2995309 RepID=A0ABT5D4B9_9BACT|nr:suppressor of fused domain protein [Stigmatella ashevillena]MDC0708506.1 suppressor of fused domain protein [Stigmatella ashevillena]
MSLFDWFKKKKPEPVSAPAQGVLPVGEGEIIEYAVADSTGAIRLEGGALLRFGRSACRGFEPTLGAKVLVRQSGPSPFGGGFRALEVELRPGPGNEVLDALLGASHPGCSAAEACAYLGTITVLLAEPPPSTPMALQAWFDSLGLDALGIRVSVQPFLRFHFAGCSVPAVLGEGPYPQEGLDLREVPPGFDLGRAYLGLMMGPSLERQMRALSAVFPHPFGPQGEMRLLARLVVALLRRGTGVVLNRARETVCGREDFIQRLGDLDDAACMPWTAWVTLAVGPERDGYSSLGMGAFGLSEVSVPFERGDRWAECRAVEAVRWACAKMVREDRPLAGGETLEVPVRARAGAWPSVSEGALERYRVEVGKRAVLRRQPSTPPGEAWRTQPSQVPLNAYQAILDEALGAQLPGDAVAEYPSTHPGAPPYALLVRKAERAYAVFTSGFGRKVQPGGEGAGLPRIELGTFLPVPNSECAALVGSVARFIFSRERSAEAFKPGDRLDMPMSKYGIAGFVLAQAATLALYGGPGVTLLVLVPITAAEFSSVKHFGSGSLLQSLGEGATFRAAIARRWRLPQA